MYFHREFETNENERRNAQRCIFQLRMFENKKQTPTECLHTRTAIQYVYSLSGLSIEIDQMCEGRR